MRLRWMLHVGLTALALAGCSHPAPPTPAASPDASSTAAAIDAGPSQTKITDSFPIAKELVEAALNPNGLPAYSGPTGSVEGTVYVTGPASPDVTVDATRGCPAAIDTYGKLFRSGTPAHPGDPRPLADAVVVVMGYSGFYIPEREPAKKVVIGENCAYPGRAITMTYGQRLEVMNDSTVPFAPTIEDQFSPAVMMAPPRRAGDAVKIYPRVPGFAALTDRIQLFSRVELYVLRQPLHTVSALDGHYRIDGLPIGKLTVSARQAGVGSEVAAPVEVVANVVRQVDLTLIYAPKPPVKRPWVPVIP
jgi:hypothetical protein